MLHKPDQVLDASGLECPMPLLKTKLRLNDMSPGELLQVVASDPGSARDIPAFLKFSHHELESCEEQDSRYYFMIRCGQPWGRASAEGEQVSS